MKRQKEMPPKKLAIVKGKGTKKETRIETNIWLYWSENLQTYVSIPPKN